MVAKIKIHKAIHGEHADVIPHGHLNLGMEQNNDIPNQIGREGHYKQGDDDDEATPSRQSAQQVVNHIDNGQ